MKSITYFPLFCLFSDLMALCLHQRYGMSKAPISERAQHLTSSVVSPAVSSSYDLYISKRKRIETYDSVKTPKVQQNYGKIFFTYSYEKTFYIFTDQALHSVSHARDLVLIFYLEYKNLILATQQEGGHTLFPLPSLSHCQRMINLYAEFLYKFGV